MSNNFSALLHAAVVATKHTVPAAVGTTGANVAAVQGNAAAVGGAAAHGAANVAAADVATAVGSPTTAQQSLDTQPPAAAVPGNSGVPSLDSQPVGEVTTAGQPAAPPGRHIPNALRRTDSTTDCVKRQDDGQYYSMRMLGTVDNPFAHHFPPPPSFDDPREDPREPEDSDVPVSPPQAAEQATKTFPFVPPVVDASKLPPLPVLTLDELLLNPLVFPKNLFAPQPTSLAVPANPSDDKFWPDINVRAKEAHLELGWEGPGERLHRHVHNITPDDCQKVRRWEANHHLEDVDLLKAEARCTENKNEQVTFLKELRHADLAKPPHLRENFVTCAEVDLKLQLERIRERRLLVGAQVAFLAQDFFPAPPVLPSPPPRTIWSAMAGAVVGLLKRKREEDEPALPSAKRIRVKQGPRPQRRFAFLRDLDMEPLPRPRWGDAESHPDHLPYRGAAAYPALYLTSEAATQTGEEPESPPVAGPSRHPQSHNPAPVAAGVAGPSRKLIIVHAPPSPTPLLTDDSQPAAPLAAGERGVRFALHTASARPQRSDKPPERRKIGAGDTSRKDASKTQQLPTGVFSKRDWVTLAPSTLKRMARGLDSDAVFGPTDRDVWSHPLETYATYQDASTQYRLPSPSPPPSPSREAAARKKVRRGTRAGGQVQRRRALKEAATATENDDIKMVDDAA